MRIAALGVLFVTAAGSLSTAADQPQYRITARIEGEAVIGRVEIAYFNRAGRPLRKVPLELTKGTTLTDAGTPPVSSGGKEILLPAPLAPDGEVGFSAGFKARLRDLENLGYRFSRDWYPRVPACLNGRFDGRERQAARFDVTLQVPAAEVIAASGRLDRREALPGGYQQLRFLAGPVSSFGIAASPSFRRIERDAAGATVHEYQLPQNAEWNCKRFADTAVEVIAFYRKTFGDYPHDSLSILPGLPEATGGNAPTGNIIAVHKQMGSTSTGFERWIVAHEIGHMLWGFESVLETRDSHWLGLGLGLYSDRLFTESLDDFPTEFQRHMIDQYLGLPAAGKSTRFAAGDDGRVNHGKGFAVVQMLEQLTGPERFLELTQRLQREYRWRRLAPAELQLEAEKAAGRPLDWFFSDWVENDRALRVEIDSVTTLPDGAVEVRVRHAGTARMPVNCEVRREDGTGVRLRLERDPAEQVLRFEQAAPVRLVRLDPEHRLPLFDPENKSWRGRPWVTMKVEGLRLLARNEGREDHAVRLSAGQGKRARSRQRTLRPGEEMTLDLPEADAPTVGYDLTDHVKLPLSGPRD